MCLVGGVALVDRDKDLEDLLASPALELPSLEKWLVAVECTDVLTVGARDFGYAPPLGLFFASHGYLPIDFPETPPGTKSIFNFLLKTHCVPGDAFALFTRGHF